MFDCHSAAPFYGTAAQLHGAAGALGDQDVGPGLFEIIKFRRQDFGRYLREFARVGAAESAAGFLFFGWNKHHAPRFDQGMGCFPDAESPAEVAGRMVGRAGSARLERVANGIGYILLKAKISKISVWRRLPYDWLYHYYILGFISVKGKS
jgi:hypothetical protein